VAKIAKTAALPNASVRTRRAYFDCRYGQLHVRTAFPTTGGFGEQVTLVCLHPASGSSRVFARFLPLIAAARSVYAPDLPGSGESDGPPAGTPAEQAESIADLAAELRLRQIDVLGLHAGAAVAIELGLAKPQLVRRLVLVGNFPRERAPSLRQPCLVLSIGAAAHAARAAARELPPNARHLDAAEYADDLFDAAPKTLAKQFAAFLDEAAAG
jgi:pimeloyl-ACP methyl ester carboxylesterase